MNLILNGEAQAFDASECANLAELVAACERFEVAGEESVVVGVEINGEPLPPEELSDLASRRLDSVETVAIQRRPALDVARSVLEQGADYSGQIAKAIEQTVGYYRGGRSDLGNDLLVNVTDSLTVLTGITYSVSNVLVEEAQILADLQGEIYPCLEQLVEAQGNDDPILIADTLEYEVSPRIVQWGATMRALMNGPAAAAEALSERVST